MTHSTSSPLAYTTSAVICSHEESRTDCYAVYADAVAVKGTYGEPSNTDNHKYTLHSYEVLVIVINGKI
jgi:hypothetical protein